MFLTSVPGQGDREELGGAWCGAGCGSTGERKGCYLEALPGAFSLGGLTSEPVRLFPVCALALPQLSSRGRDSGPLGTRSEPGHVLPGLKVQH